MPKDTKLSEFEIVSADASKQSRQKVISNSLSLQPSAVVSLFEIDVEQLLIDMLVPYDLINRNDAVFRFHNNLKLTKQDIVWRGQTYKAAPIQVTGYESSAKGTLAAPRLSFSADEGSTYFRQLRGLLRQLEDLIGAKVSRIRTFAKYLDKENFYVSVGGKDHLIGDKSTEPKDFEPDPLAEFPREIFFIERKAAESKIGLEFELTTPTNLETARIPNRKVIARTCQFSYRGEGCLYEYKSRFQLVDALNRADAENTFGSDNIKALNFPEKAPPVATENNELIKDIVSNYSANRSHSKWATWLTYSKGDIVFIEKNGIRYFYVAKVNITETAEQRLSVAPPNRNYWVADTCSKNLEGCKLRWNDAYKKKKGLDYVGAFQTSAATRGAGTHGDGNTHNGCLPFGGFPASQKLEDYNT